MDENKEYEEYKEFLVPDYFEAFKCKMGDCRNACCQGWNVSISMKNYFDLLGAECSDDLRHKIDCCMIPSERRSEDEYAVLGCGYDGNCKLRASDGSCSLQNELGEDALPDICRLYPRGVRYDEVHGYECSMANSCEKVPEMFMGRTKPLEFIKIRLPIKVPENIPRKYPLESFGCEHELRLYFISIMQDRTKRIPERLMTLFNVFVKLEAAFKNDDRSYVLSLIGHAEKPDAPPLPEVTENTVKNGLLAIEHMMKEISERSFTVHETVEHIFEKYNNASSLTDIYFKLRGKFEALYPKNEILLEHLLVNHMFFTMFPYQDRPETFHDEFCALCAVYTMLRFLLLGSVDEIKNADDLADIISLAFRFIEHTDFDRFSARLIKKLNCDKAEILASLVSL